MTPVIIGGLRLRAKIGGHRPLTPAGDSGKRGTRSRQKCPGASPYSIHFSNVEGIGY